jgi:hypothetical protein
MIPYDLAVLLDVVNELPLSELRKACERAGYDAQEVLNIIASYGITDEE